MGHRGKRHAPRLMCDADGVGGWMTRQAAGADGREALGHCLTRARAARVTGSLHVEGNPGGVIVLRDGQVLVVESPGAPGVQALLIHSGRIGDARWAQDNGLLDRAATASSIGSAHLQVVQVMANQDALFAILAGSIGECLIYPSRAADQLPAHWGDDPSELMTAAVRKLSSLAALPAHIMPSRERLVPVPQAASIVDRDSEARDTTAIRDSILRHADGRRTARDIAFLTGRSLYPVAVEMSRMLAEGLLEEPPASPGPDDPRPVTMTALRPLAPCELVAPRVTASDPTAIQPTAIHSSAQPNPTQSTAAPFPPVRPELPRRFPRIPIARKKVKDGT